MVNQVVNNVRAFDSNAAIAPETIRTIADAVLPLVRMLDATTCATPRATATSADGTGVSMTIRSRGNLRPGRAERLRDLRYPVPTELAFDKQAQLAEIGIQDRRAIQQFVRGNAEKLTLELFCDTTDHGTGINATVTAKPTILSARRSSLASRRQSSPFLGTTSSRAIASAMRGWTRRTSFTGVAESVRQRFTMFSPEAFH